MQVIRRLGIQVGAAGLLVLALGACDRFRRPELTIPTEEQAAALYDAHDSVERVEVNGNVVELHVRQPESQLERGGSLWARVGPYIYLFAPPTKELLLAYPGVAAVRVITFVDDGREVARVMMRRDALSDILWRRSQNLLGHALRSGTEQPRRLEELVEWGEQYADAWYSPDYVGP